MCYDKYHTRKGISHQFISVYVKIEGQVLERLRKPSAKSPRTESIAISEMDLTLDQMVGMA
jgi:hypothetical protein